MDHSVTARMPWAIPYIIMATARSWMLLVSEMVRNVMVRSVKAMMMGSLYPALSVSFPDGMRDNMFVMPLMPKRKATRDAMTDCGSGRIFSACIAKRVRKKAFVKEKTKRRYARISMFREELRALSDPRRFRLGFSWLIELGFLSCLIKRRGAKPMRGISDAIWKSWG